jgi:hypothetical protein
VLGSERGVLQWLSLIDRFGFALVRNVEPTPQVRFAPALNSPVSWKADTQGVQATQTLMERAGVIRSTIFGSFWDFTANMEFSECVYPSAWRVTPRY